MIGLFSAETSTTKFDLFCFYAPPPPPPPLQIMCCHVARYCVRGRKSYTSLSTAAILSIFRFSVKISKSVPRKLDVFRHPPPPS